jgi:hypothetical protein
MSTKHKKAKAQRKTAKNAGLAETLKAQMITSVAFLEKLQSIQSISPGDAQVIALAGNAELDNFRELLARFLTSRGVASITVEAPTNPPA